MATMDNFIHKSDIQFFIIENVCKLQEEARDLELQKYSMHVLQLHLMAYSL